MTTRAFERAPIFSLVRFFLITSALAAAVITLAIWIYRQSEVNQLVDIAESANITLARSLANAIWPRYSSFIATTSASVRPSASYSAEIQELDDTVRAISAGLPILKVKLYGMDGVTIFSSVGAEIDEEKTDNVSLLAAAQVGNSASQLSFRDEITSFEGTVQNRDVVESYLPLRDGTGSVQGVFELYSDVTPLMDRIRGVTINIAFGFIVGFGALYGILFLVVRKADQTIAQQYLTITEKNATLQWVVSRSLWKLADGASPGS